jgi:hypothetical protein
VSRSAAKLPRSCAAAAIVAAAALLGAAACAPDRRPVERCSDPLDGVWRADERAPSGEPYRFHILDRGAAIEIYPIFDDAVPPDGSAKLSGIIYAPAVIDLQRNGQLLHGTESRRLVRGTQTCVRKLPAVIAAGACSGDRLTLGIALAAPDPDGGIDWTTCAHRPTGKRRVLKLTRE